MSVVLRPPAEWVHSGRLFWGPPAARLHRSSRDPYRRLLNPPLPEVSQEYTARDWNKSQRVLAARKCVEQIVPSPHWRPPSSIATVAIGNSAREGAVLCILLERFAPGIPVYVICDPLNAWRFDEFRQVTVIPSATPEDLTRLTAELSTLSGTNFIHDNAAISYKFEAMRRAMISHGDCLFLDADFVPLAEVLVPAHCKIGMSPHYAGDPDIALLNRYAHSGVFNVGQVWTSDPKFIERWEWMFLHDSPFLEQEPLNAIALERPQDIGYWPPTENHGFWRKGLPDKETVRSCHAHLSLDHLGRADMSRQAESFALASRVMQIMAARDQVSYWRVAKALGMPTRLCFVHIPKTGGVTAIKTLIDSGVIHLGLGHQFHDGAKGGPDLWTELEGAAQILAAPEQPGVFEMAHKHHFAWTRQELEIARENGWLVFSFLRDPLDLICSKYWYFRRAILNGEILPFPAWRDSKDPTRNQLKMPLTKFLFLAMREPELRKRWELPEWFHDLVQLKMPFSGDTLRNWIRTTWLIDPGDPARHNVSGNTGFLSYLNQVDPQIVAWLRTHLKVQEFSRYIPVRFPTEAEMEAAHPAKPNIQRRFDSQRLISRRPPHRKP